MFFGEASFQVRMHLRFQMLEFGRAQKLQVNSIKYPGESCLQEQALIVRYLKLTLSNIDLCTVMIIHEGGKPKRDFSQMSWQRPTSLVGDSEDF